MENILLSVIIPVYNAEKYLSRAIDSIVNQTYQNYELILVNDGSVDDSLNICNLYSKNNKKIIVINKSNGGPSSARIAGVEAAKGDYVTFVDADDYIDIDYNEKLCTPINENRDIDIVLGTFVREENGKTTCTFEKIDAFEMDSLDAIYNMLLERYFKWSMDMKIIRRELLLDNADWPKSYGEDLYINWKLFSNASLIRYVPTSGYHYCKESGSLMRSGFNPDKMTCFDIWKKIADWAYENHYFNILKEIVRVMVKDGSEIIYEAEKDYINNEQYIKKALQIIEEYIYLCKFDFANNYTNGNLEYRFDFVNKDMECIIDRQRELIGKLKAFASKYSSLYLYGAGKVALEIQSFMVAEKQKIKGFIVTKKDNNIENCLDFESFIAKRIDNCGVIVALNKKNTEDVRQRLIDNKIDFIEVGKYVYYFQ